MKLLCLLLCVYLSILTTLKWLIMDENFDGFTQFENVHASAFKGHNQSTKSISYTRQCLVQIGEKVKHDRQINRLSPSTCANIRNLRLNNIPKRKQRRKRAGKRKVIRQNGTNLDNLIKIKCIPKQNSRIGIKCFTVNSRSLSNKEMHVRNFILDNGMDFGIVTETWYKDDSWGMSDINTFGLKTQTVNRKNRKSEGGLALVYRQQYQCESLKTQSYPALELGLW